MNTLLVLMPLIIFVLGLVIGSFLNVVVYRLNTGKSIAKGRSMCMSCAKQLHWYELVPVFSFLFQKGKCTKCREPISFQYPLVELITAILFVLIYMKVLFPFGLSFVSVVSFFGALYVASLLIVIMMYDIRHKIIPDTLVYQLIALGIGVLLFRDLVLPTYGVFFGFLQGMLVALPFYLIWLFTRGRGIGFGDVKLSFALGLLLGLAQGIVFFFLSFWIGAVVGVILLALSKKYSMKSEIAFAPFMIIAFFLVTLWQIDMSNLFSFLF
jgi:leader peptidase (prepilin peptidase)/N-methyltransferase